MRRDCSARGDSTASSIGMSRLISSIGGSSKHSSALVTASSSASNSIGDSKSEAPRTGTGGGSSGLKIILAEIENRSKE